MKLVATINYNDVKFKWIEDHYDIDLIGLCYYKEKTHYFKTNDDDYFHDREIIHVNIYSLGNYSRNTRWSWYRKNMRFLTTFSATLILTPIVALIFIYIGNKT